MHPLACPVMAGLAASMAGFRPLCTAGPDICGKRIFCDGDSMFHKEPLSPTTNHRDPHCSRILQNNPMSANQGAGECLRFFGGGE